MKTLHMVAVVVALVFATIGAAIAAEIPEKIAENHSTLINQRAPEIALPGVAGTERTLGDFAGKFVVLEWFDYTCPFVRKHYDSKNMQKLQAEFAKQGVVWLTVSSVRPGTDGYLSGKPLRLRLAQEKSKAADFLIDSTGSAQQLFGVTVTPTVVLIDPDGIVRYFGAVDDQPSNDPANIAKATNYLRTAFEAVKANRAPVPAGTLAYGCPAPATSRAGR